LIEVDGIKQVVSRIQALLDIPEPQNAGKLQQFLCSVGWMRTAIPAYARIAKKLRDKLEQALTDKTKKKIIAAGIAIQLTQDESSCFTAIKDALATRPLQHFRRKMPLFVCFRTHPIMDGGRS
jgi:hypothetical protein